MPAERGLGLRRNGKKQSCEPCRKGKLACDHATPHCGRCVRRKQTEKCFYHPAPMTRPKALPTLHGTPSTASDQSNNQEHSPRTIETSNVSVPPTTPNTSQSLPWLQNQVPEVLEPLETTAQYIAALPTPEERKAACIARRMTWRTSRFQKSRRYQGPTSFTAVFSEGQSKFSENLLDIGEDDRPHPAMWPFNAQPLLGRRRPGAPNIRINETRKALWNVPSRDVCNRLLETFESFHNESMNEVIIRHSIETLWATFEGQLSEPRTEEKLDEITKVLLKNEERPLPPAPTDGIEWLDTFTGPNLRFESLGLLFCFFGMAYHMLQDLDPLFESQVNKDDPNRIHGRTRDRRQTAWRMSECADMCLKMTDCSETINELVVALLLNLLLLETNCAGEESYKIRRRHGDLVTATIAVGLHRIPEYGINGATTAGEYIRRLFAVVYIIDKRNSSSNGTPPLLNRLYCNHRSAFELTNEELFLPQNQLNQVISELDPNGWKLTTDIWNTSLHRALFLFSVIRDEILGLSLGVDVEVSAFRIEDLYQRCRSTYADLPERLHYYLLDTTPKKSSGKTLFFQAMLALELLQNKFLLDRIAVARGLPNEQRLLNTALEMMDITIMFWTKRDHLMGFCCHFDWFITCYGVPSAGVLCVELLKQTKQPHESRVIFSRSDAIQNLTMFLGFLEWIRPTDGNFELAGRLRKVVRRILDYVLEPPQLEQQEEEVRGSVSDDFTHMDFGLDQTLSLDEMDCLDWLNTVDWTQGPWMEVN